MKNLLVALLLLFTNQLFAQFPVVSSLGAPKSTVLTKGIHGADSGLVLRTSYTSFSQLTNSSLGTVPGVIVRVGSDLYIRNQSATSWAKLSPGTSLNSTTDSFSVNNPDAINTNWGGFTVGWAAGGVQMSNTGINDIVGNTNVFTTNPFKTESYGYNLNPSNSLTARSWLVSEVDSAWYRFMFDGRAYNRLSSFFLTQADSTNKLLTLGFNPTFDTTKGFQLLMNTTGVNLGYRSGAYQYSAVSDSLKGIKVDATTKVSITGTAGFVPTKLTTALRTAILTPEEGLMVYDTDLHKLYVWDGTAWQAAW
jgi:hypothetical protein